MRVGLEPASVTPSKTKHLRKSTKATGAESGSVVARKGAKQDSNTTPSEWLDTCPVALTDAQRARVMEIIEGDRAGQ